MMIIKKIGNGIKTWWKNFLMNDDERYLSQATDIVDLEFRMRALESIAFKNKGFNHD